MAPVGPMAQEMTQAIPWGCRACPKPLPGTGRGRLGCPAWWRGAVHRPIPRMKRGKPTEEDLGGRWGSPDLTLPLVEMAEMERPVMVVTVTESRMMIQVRTVGADGDGITPKLSQGSSRVSSSVRNLSQPTDSPCDLSHFPPLSLFSHLKICLCPGLC